VYGDDLIGGVNFQGGRSEPAVRHVHDVGDGRLLIEARSAPADGFTLVSHRGRGCWRGCSAVSVAAADRLRGTGVKVTARWFPAPPVPSQRYELAAASEVP